MGDWAYPSSSVLDANEVLLAVGDELAGEGRQDVVWRHMAQAGPEAESFLGVGGDEGRVDLVAGEDEDGFGGHGGWRDGGDCGKLLWECVGVEPRSMRQPLETSLNCSSARQPCGKSIGWWGSLRDSRRYVPYPPKKMWAISDYQFFPNFWVSGEKETPTTATTTRSSSSKSCIFPSGTSPSPLVLPRPPTRQPGIRCSLASPLPFEGIHRTQSAP